MEDLVLSKGPIKLQRALRKIKITQLGNKASNVIMIITASYDFF